MIYYRVLNYRGAIRRLLRLTKLRSEHRAFLSDVGDFIEIKDLEDPKQFEYVPEDQAKAELEAKAKAKLEANARAEAPGKTRTGIIARLTNMMALGGI